MMDDGRLVICSIIEWRLLIFNSDVSYVETIQVTGIPCCVTAVNISTVALVVLHPVVNEYIDLYDINNKHKLKSVTEPGMKFQCDITKMNDKLEVGSSRGLVIVDYQTGEKNQLTLVQLY